MAKGKMNAVKFNRLLARYKFTPRAVQELYEYYYPLIVRHIERIFRGAVDGRDIAHQFFLRLFDLKEQKIRSPNAWVYTVARNIAYEVLRKAGRKFQEGGIAEIKVDFLQDNVLDYLKELNEVEQKVIYLKYWEKYKLKEIAEKLKIK